ncbi:hypothetical protein F2Q68_00004106 [Brassica cretica]|uniref:Uncharacterized protein n=1 Tax=Brassica cretica TaxID=69181 RepID=A0A8S9J9M4_BRACR|nr:hypothetical protein F2Q68_00004106 [Brassica cretica]
MKSSTTTIKKNSTLNMRGRSSGMIRNGVNFQPLKPIAPLKRESVRTVHNHQAHTQLVKLIKVPFDPLVLRQQRFLVRRLW